MKLFLGVAGAVVALIILLILRAAYTLYSVGTFKKAWGLETSQSIEPESIVIAALGDSTAQGVGGLNRGDSFVSQVASRIMGSTGKKVQIFNYSVTGAVSAEVLETQVPKFNKLARVDAVLIAVGPNDITHKKSLNSFLKNYEQILKQVPADKTVISNMPPMGPKDIDGKSSYDWSLALRPLAKKYNVRLARVYENVSPRQNDFRTYGGDFYHPSKEGYKLWANAFTPEVKKILGPSTSTGSLD